MRHRGADYDEYVIEGPSILEFMGDRKCAFEGCNALEFRTSGYCHRHKDDWEKEVTELATKISQQDRKELQQEAKDAWDSSNQEWIDDMRARMDEIRSMSPTRTHGKDESSWPDEGMGILEKHFSPIMIISGFIIFGAPYGLLNSPEAVESQWWSTPLLCLSGILMFLGLGVAFQTWLESEPSSTSSAGGSGRGGARLPSGGSSLGMIVLLIICLPIVLSVGTVGVLFFAFCGPFWLLAAILIPDGS